MAEGNTAMRKMRLIRLTATMVLTMMLGLFVQQGQAVDYAHDGVLTVTVYNCPDGMTADTLEPMECPVATDGVDLELWYGEGQGVTLPIEDATFDGTSYTWSGLPISDEPIGFGVTQLSFPAGYVDNVVTNDGETFRAHSSSGASLSLDQPAGFVDFYNFTAMPAVGQADLLIIARACPAGYDGDDFVRACNGRVPNVTFTIGDIATVVTGADGIARSVIVPEDLAITPELPVGIDHVVYGTRRIDGSPVTFEQTEDGIVLLGPEDENGIHHRDSIDIDAYFVPSAEGPAQIAVSLYAISCPQDPGNTSPASGAFPPEGCEYNPGVWMWVTDTDGAFVGSCATDDSGECVISASDGAAIIVTEDEETIPTGYTPRENPISTEARTEFAQAVFVNLPAAEEPTVTATHGTVAQPTDTPVPANARPAHIHGGACGSLTRGTSIELVPLIPIPSDATPVGAPNAISAETSFSVIDVSLDDLLATPHAINVHTSTTEMRAYLVCGEIGGVRGADGSLAIGLRETRGSGYEGIAYLLRDADDAKKTDVWVFIAPTLAEEEHATPVPVASPATTPGA